MNSNISFKTQNRNKTARLHKPDSIVFGLLSVTVLLLVVSTVPYSFAEPQKTVTMQLGDNLSLERTTALMSVPENNTLPWGSVRGTVDDPAQGYPVIIQFYNEQNGDDPVHIAQVDIKEDDNTYEYKFRVRNVDPDTGIATNIFEGDYTVRIFKVVNSHNNLDTI